MPSGLPKPLGKLSSSRLKILVNPRVCPLVFMKISGHVQVTASSNQLHRPAFNYIVRDSGETTSKNSIFTEVSSKCVFSSNHNELCWVEKTDFLFSFAGEHSFQLREYHCHTDFDMKKTNCFPCSFLSNIFHPRLCFPVIMEVIEFLLCELGKLKPWI